MSTGPEIDGAVEVDVLDRPEAGGKAIRGGGFRLGAYGLGVLLSLGSAPLLTRHLGVEDFGSYVTVMSLAAVVALIADAGLTVVGLRQYATRPPATRAALIGSIVAIRTLITLGATGVAVAFALLAGYRDVMVWGSLVACLALVFTMAQQTATIPLQAQLRFGATSLLDLLRAALAAVGAVVLVLLGASLFDFFVWALPSALIVLAATLMIERRWSVLRPRWSPQELRGLVVEAVPAAAASVLNSLFYRLSVIVLSLIAVREQVGYYSAAYRIVEVMIVIPGLLVGTAFPILARAAESDLARLRYAVQLLFEVGLMLGVLITLGTALSAETAIALLAGPDFEAAVQPLRVQALALVASFPVAIFAATLFTLKLRRDLVLTNLVGVVAMVGLAALGARQGAIGTAIGATVAEWLLALMLGVVLAVRQPELRVRMTFVLKVAVAAAVGVLGVLVPGPDVLGGVVGCAAYVAVLVALRAVPLELLAALREGRSADQA